LRLFSFGGYGLALAALALVVFGAIECLPLILNKINKKSHIRKFILIFSLQNVENLEKKLCKNHC